MHDESSRPDLPDRMSPAVTIAGYGIALAIIVLMFWLAAPIS